MSAVSECPTKSNIDIYFDEARHYTPLSREEEAILAQAIRRHDDEALHRLVKANLRFVVTIAKQYARFGVPMEDLINEGNLGLMEAAKRFDETRGYKFISYAVWWIRQSIMAALAEQSKSVRMPLNRARLLHKLRQSYTRLEQRLERAPEPDELAGDMKIPLKEVKRTLPLLHDSVQLDSAIGDDEEVTYGDFLMQEDAPSPELPILKAELRRGITEALRRLRPREAEVLRLYFGLDGHEAKTLQEIGERMNVSRERIRQIKAEALDKMRSSRRFQFLKDYREMTALN